MKSTLKCAAIAVLSLLTLSGCTTTGEGMDRGASMDGRANHGAVASRERMESVSMSFPSQRPATGKNVFIYDPKQHAWAAYDHQGSLVRSGPGSGGSTWCADLGRPCRTAVGHFSVYRKGGAGCVSSKFPLRRNGRSGGAPMPHCMFFHNGMAIHASNDIPARNASHGCIRVPKTDAAWLHNDFMSIGTTVIVKPY